MLRVAPVLNRFDTFIYKDKDVADKAQVPAAGVVYFYAQGATLMADQDFQPPNFQTPIPVTIIVWHTGQLQAGDTVVVDYIADSQLSVQAVDHAAGQITLARLTPGVVNALAGQRLIVTSKPVQIYRDPVGASPQGHAVAIEAGTGRVRAYLREPRFDYVVITNPLQPPLQIHIDAVGSFVMRG